ncbi:MAG: glyoxalase [Lachnospiraceae bacterium]|nr:glyoxalase [Lachnospiraceae bacterium]
MKLKNILLVVKDIEHSKKFYQDLSGLAVVTDFGGNVILTEGLVLQDKRIWETLIGKESIPGHADKELYFEENDLDAFQERLTQYPGTISYLNPLMEHSWGQRVIRILDPDGHVIEIGEALDFTVRRLYKSGMSPEQAAEKTGLPLAQVQGICGV